MTTRRDKTSKTLRDGGYKSTPQRIAVLNVINNSPGHLTPAALYEKVQKKYPGIGRVTVYRTLNILAGLGLICRVRAGDNEWGYVACPRQHHDHVICSGCGKVVDFTGCNLEMLRQRLSRETGFTIEDHHLEFLGRCQDCQKKSTSATM